MKSAIVTPLPKKTPASILEKDIRPISLTCLIAKELERIVIKRLRLYTSTKSDPLQFGNKKGVSTTDMLIKLLHNWHAETDKGHAVRIVFLDYSKAFDRVNHNILLDKLAAYDLPPFLLKWLTSFLFERSQRVRLSEFISDILYLAGAVPQGAIFGMEGFLALIDDLRPPLPLFKYVDDSTAFDILRKSNPDSSALQDSINETVKWTRENDMKINAQKTHEMIISFSKSKPDPLPSRLMVRILPESTAQS